MLTEKPKRKRKHPQKSLIRTVLIALIVLPSALFALHPAIGDSLIADGIAISVMMCSAVYIVHEAIVGFIRSYLRSDTDAGDSLADFDNSLD